LTNSYLLDVVVTGVGLDVVLADPLLFLAPDVEDDFLFPFLCVALSTASLYGNFIWDGVALTIGIMLVSVLQLADFFCFFFGGPLRIMEVCQLNKLINLAVHVN
jgi:hypothetical protein